MIKLSRIINNTIISLLGQVISWTSTLLLTIAYAHYLGASKYGELYFAIAFITLVGIPINSSYTNQIIRDIAQEPDKAPRYYSNILLIKLGMWPIICSLSLLVIWLLGYPFEIFFLVGVSSFILLSGAIASTFASLHYAFERTIFPTVGMVLENGLTAIFSIFLLKAGAGVQVMALVMLGGSLVNMIWQALWFFRLVGTNFVIDWPLIREIVRINIPFLLSALLITGYTSIDTFLLSVLTNSAEVGWYGAANRLFDAINFIPNIIIMTVMYPIFSKLSTNSDENLKLSIEKSVNFLLFCSIPITIGLIITAPNIIGFLYGGSGFSQSISTLQLLAPGVIFVFLNFALYTIILSKKQERKFLIIATITLAFNLGLNLILISLYRHTGAAIVNSLTEALLCFICVIFVREYLHLYICLRVAFKAFIASIIMALIILPLHEFNIFVILPIATFVYFGISVLLGTIPRQDYVTAYHAIRQKAQLPSKPDTKGLSETQHTSFYADALLEYHLAITMKLPALRLKSVPPRPLKAIRLEPIQQGPLTRQGQIGPQRRIYQ